jgi:hypothetical protein
MLNCIKITTKYSGSREYQQVAIYQRVTNGSGRGVWQRSEVRAQCKSLSKALKAAQKLSTETGFPIKPSK